MNSTSLTWSFIFYLTPRSNRNVTRTSLDTMLIMMFEETWYLSWNLGAVNIWAGEGEEWLLSALSQFSSCIIFAICMELVVSCSRGTLPPEAQNLWMEFGVSSYHPRWIKRLASGSHGSLSLSNISVNNTELQTMPRLSFIKFLRWCDWNASTCQLQWYHNKQHHKVIHSFLQAILPWQYSWECRYKWVYHLLLCLAEKYLSDENRNR